MGEGVDASQCLVSNRNSPSNLREEARGQHRLEDPKTQSRVHRHSKPAQVVGYMEGERTVSAFSFTSLWVQLLGRLRQEDCKFGSTWAMW